MGLRDNAMWFRAFWGGVAVALVLILGLRIAGVV